MTRSELINSLLESHSYLARKDAEEAVEVILNAIMRAVAEGKRVEIRNFGVFSASLRKAHLARNPKTGKPVPKASARFPKFRAGKPLRALAAKASSVNGEKQGRHQPLLASPRPLNSPNTAAESSSG
jgi:integration host factor subunit beta